jgi:hypothetical protein
MHRQIVVGISNVIVHRNLTAGVIVLHAGGIDVHDEADRRFSKFCEHA